MQYRLLLIVLTAINTISNINSSKQDTGVTHEHARNTGWDHEAPNDSYVTAAEITGFRLDLSFEADDHFSDNDIVEFIENGCGFEEAEAEYLETECEMEEAA